MATLKHINSKNADYGAAEQYLLFEHDEFTMKPVLDETGRLIPREDYRLSTLNCGGEDFAVACMRANLRYEKNQRREDVKSHHYIISFDPRDGPDNGLTVDRAQALGEKFCAEHFPGHQALVCTHPDGHNHSGNIHVHIVINSLRIEEVPFLPYMDRPADTKAGCKHRCTDAALRYFKSEVMEMCHREGLYQIDLLNGSKNRVTDREYWAQKKGQAALDKQNAPMIAGGITPRQTKFETNKEKLRQTIRAALSAATSFEDFSSLLLREGVAVKESRGRLSYLTPDRTKPITARKLGDDFDRAAVLAVLEQNAQRGVTVHSVPQPQTHAAGAAEKTEALSIKDQLRADRAAKTAPKEDGVQRLVDIEQKMAEGKGRGYERWAAMHNLKQMAATLNVYQEYGFTSPEQLEAAVDTAYQEMRQTSGELKTLETKLQGKKELQRQVLAYAKTKPARDGLKAQKSEKARAAYRQAHESDFIIADAAARYFREHGITKLPARKALQDEIEQLVSKKSGLYNTYHEQKQRYAELQTVKRNIDQILRRSEPRRRKEQSHER
ncbi:relaxase [Faecalibacterium prausnitzii]|uniref:Relaxase n=2 Tax=Eubacteriales TaxID=186802 RepID=A0A329U305_9FIRM|nr:relaxase/mobilization nuclease domain-containing protein [Faecalibacterium prausnitzii]RAW56172.1 relaxase [Faecalibacterium prausnitzii]